MLVSSTLFFPHNVFERLVFQRRENLGLFGKGLKEEYHFYDNKTFLV